MLFEIAQVWFQSRFEAIERSVFLLIGVAITYGSIVYLMTRYGRLRRSLQKNHPSSRAQDIYFYAENTPRAPLTVLIPSYKEEFRTIEMTLLSVALQEYPEKNIVLLIDDPVSYTDPKDQRLLERSRALPSDLQNEFDEMQQKAERAFAAFIARQTNGKWNALAEIRIVAEVFEEQQRWYEKQLQTFDPQNHTEHFFSLLKFGNGRDRMKSVRHDIYALQDSSTPCSPETITQYYRKACATFKVTFSVFQRRKYQNLSHEPNKAMNLNSYIGLIGGSWKEVQHEDGTWLEACTAPEADLVVPQADYLITLDADSVLSASYARRLVYHLEQPGNERIAVAQTPYNTFRSPFIGLEHIAGATTDIQHNIHQGFEYFHASYWVGANALLRMSALTDIKETDTERGHTIYRFVQDRTVIEDTESSIDLVTKGWEVHNYQEQLAYSATPPDFGSLIIQRRRWANGGLIIYPKLLWYFLAGNNPFRRRLVESFVRAHYLLSIALVNLSVLAMILYPFNGNLHIGWLIATALLYFVFYARDLIQLGYTWVDLFRVYSLNLLLIPVNVAGTLKSIQQLITKRKIPFGRTPKVAGRTAASLGLLFAEFGLTLYMILALFFDLSTSNYAHAIFSGINAAFFLYALHRFIGWRAAFGDTVAGLQYRNKN